jgi:hypothetical protein
VKFNRKVRKGLREERKEIVSIEIAKRTKKMSLADFTAILNEIKEMQEAR